MQVHFMAQTYLEPCATRPLTAQGPLLQFENQNIDMCYQADAINDQRWRVHASDYRRPHSDDSDVNITISDDSDVAF